MANSANNIKESWSLISFAKSHGKPQLGKFINEETGETWKSCIFTDPSNPDNKTFVSFSRNLGELTAQQIKEQKDDLQVNALLRKARRCSPFARKVLRVGRMLTYSKLLIDN